MQLQAMRKAQGRSLDFRWTDSNLTQESKRPNHQKGRRSERTSLKLKTNIYQSEHFQSRPQSPGTARVRLALRHRTLQPMARRAVTHYNSCTRESATSQVGRGLETLKWITI
ncbi:hypothetical protein EVAR_90364_1 [Eumeta japonica]|uniref:Uncharacterized protein n=1 Tax=Eumeta variegata TaxID=151549 RepID=A0A4C1Y7F6_EUMVA|nr:hypothetical protein EVAR_90364_1 [Eumeta japonica]